MKRHVRTIALSLTSSLLLTCCSSLDSLTTIQPGRPFELGGNQHGAFTARLQNVGDVPVAISERQIDGQRIDRGTFQPGDQKTVRFASGSAVLVNNASTKSAQLHLVITGDKNLRMRELNN